jgi:ubiquinone/menaquinone biosynthesis C-methylase UbiE
VVDEIVSGRGAAYRQASEALQTDDPSWVRRAAHYRMLAQCGLQDLIRADFFALLALPEQAGGALLDAGCGAGGDTVELARKAPGLVIHGVDVSSLALGHAAANAISGGAQFHQTALERLPFADAAFDYVSSHEVIEHVEDPQLVARELGRVLKPGGICVIATPNGASLWIEHLRQRFMRALGRRGAPIGADHTRSPRFWRRCFAAAGLAVERQMFDGAALEFQLFVAPASWMPVLSRVFEPLRVVPLVNLLLCDRVKFRLRKPGVAGPRGAPVAACCPICHAALGDATGGAVIIDFTALASEAQPEPARPVAAGGEAAPDPPPVPVSAGRRGWVRQARRFVLLAFGLVYTGFLLLLAPLGLGVGWFRQPFSPVAAPE